MVVKPTLAKRRSGVREPGNAAGKRSAFRQPTLHRRGQVYVPARTIMLFLLYTVSTPNAHTDWLRFIYYGVGLFIILLFVCEYRHWLFSHTKFPYILPQGCPNYFFDKPVRIATPEITPRKFLLGLPTPNLRQSGWIEKYCQPDQPRPGSG